jgi:nucleoside-diphosphate-sugar epimerase
VAKKLIIVTGSSGKIGKKVVERLKNHYEVIGLDLFKALTKIPSDHFIPTDLSSEESVYSTFQIIKDHYPNRKIASVVHLAAFYSFNTKESPLYQKITVEGTRKLLKYLQPFEVEQFIFSSTMLVHKPCLPHQKINEQWPVQGNWGYPRSKIQTEQIIRQENPAQTVILRIAGAYNEQCHSVPIAHQIQRIYERKMESYFFPGNPSHGSSFIHYEDVTEAIVKAVEKRNKLAKENIFLIGEPKTLSYRHIQELISKELFDRKIPIIRVPKIFAKAGAFFKEKIEDPAPFIKPWMIDIADDHYSLDITQARQKLDWQPKHHLEAAIPQMIKFLKKNPHKFYKENNLK